MDLFYLDNNLHPSRSPSICRYPSEDEIHPDKFDCNIVLTKDSCLDEKRR